MAVIKWVQVVDGNLKELQNHKVHNVNGNPGTPVNGQLWYNTSTNKLMYYNGTIPIDPLARSNHSGTQTASTISDLATVVQAYRLDQFAAPNVDLSMASHKLINVTDPSNPQDAATKNYVDTSLSTATAGIVWKQPVRVSTVGANITNLGTSAPSTLDGVSLSVGDRILVKDQTTAAQNGIYTVTTVGTGANGVWTRATDADSSAELQGGVVVSVDEGTTLNNTMWMLTQDVAVVGTNSVTWTQFGAGGIYVAGNGLAESPAGTFNVGAGTGITVAADTIAADFGIGTSKVMRAKIAVGAVPSGSADATVNHALGLADRDDYLCEVTEASTHAKVLCGISSTDVNNIVLSFDTAPTSNQYRYQILGLS